MDPAIGGVGIARQSLTSFFEHGVADPNHLTVWSRAEPALNPSPKLMSNLVNGILRIRGHLR
jgi:hypothetical protein